MSLASDPPREESRCDGGSDGGPTTASAMEVEAQEQYYAPRGQEQPPPGVRPAPLPEVAGPQAAVTVGYVAAVAPSLAVVLVSDMMHDDAGGRRRRGSWKR